MKKKKLPKCKSKAKKSGKLKRQSGALAFSKSGKFAKLMLITPNGGGKDWLIPKGNVARGMSSGDSAQKEAFEEAGLIGARSRRPAGYYSFIKKGRPFRVAVFLMKIKWIAPVWDEAGVRERKIFSVPAALKIIRNRGLAKIVARLPKLSKRRL